MKKYLLTWLIGMCILQFSLAQTPAIESVEAMLAQAREGIAGGNYAETLEHCQTLTAACATRQDSAGRRIWVESQTMQALCYEKTKKYIDAFNLAHQLMQQNLTAEEKERIAPIYVFNGLMTTTRWMSADLAAFAEARQVLLDILPYADEELRPYVVKRIPLCWYYEGVILHINRKLDEAVKCFDEARREFARQGTTDRQIDAAYNVADIWRDQNKQLEALEVIDQILPTARPYQDDVRLLKLFILQSKLLSRLGDTQGLNAAYREMETLTDQTDDLQVKLKYYIFRGQVGMTLQQYKLAEQYFLKVEQLLAGLPEQEVGALNNIIHAHLRDVYRVMGDYDLAIRHNRLSLAGYQAVTTASRDKSHLYQMEEAHLIGLQGNQTRCIALMDSIVDQAAHFQEPREQSIVYQFRARCHRMFENYEAALADYRKADEIMASKYGEEEAERIDLLNLQAETEGLRGHHAAAEAYSRKYATYMKCRYGSSSLDYAQALIRQAREEGNAGHQEEGIADYSQAVDSLKKIARQRLPFLSAGERECFWQDVSPYLLEMTGYALDLDQHQTEFTAACYDALVLTKSFLLETERSIYGALQAQGHTEALRDFAQLTTMRSQVRDWEKDYPTYCDSILALAPRIHALDQQLTARSSDYRDITSFMQVDYETVKQALGKREVLLDFTGYPSQQGRSYAAYIVRPNQKHPLLKPLFEERRMDALGIVRPDMYYDPDYAPEILKMLWEPLKKYVRKGATVYYVPDYLLFQISLESLPLPDGSLLGDHYHFVRLSSARELVRQDQSPCLSSQAPSAVLYGGLQYDDQGRLPLPQPQSSTEESFPAMRGCRAAQDSVFSPLPGSKTEVEQIAALLDKNRYQVSLYTGTEGTGSSFLRLNGQAPQILHLATHGFYYTPEQANQVEFLKGSTDAMSLSGLVMSGGNAAWLSGEVSESKTGGILTAYQIARLDLNRTELAVLSACQSGQGRATAEGLYGLQRAFKKAGVGTMVISLWNISDQVAMEFMIQFYECLVAPDNHWNKRRAFEKTKVLFRIQHPDPYYWAAFVMLD